MQNKPPSATNMAMSRESSSILQPENSLEVISDGKLSDIARPAHSRGSTRTMSQLSMQSTSIMSFELESLPDDNTSLTGLQEDELYLEEAVLDSNDDCVDVYSDVDIPDSSMQHLPSNSVVTRQSKDLKDRLEDSSSPDINSKEFEKEIFKLSKKFSKTKQLRENSTLVAQSNIKSSPAPSTGKLQSVNSNVESIQKEQEIDPKISRGMDKIRKLDEILAEKIKLEREAKADRKRQEKEWQLEIKGFVEWCGRKSSTPIIQQFLALTNGISDDHPADDNEDEMKPLFQTEVQAEFCDRLKDKDEEASNCKDAYEKTEESNEYSTKQPAVNNNEKGDRKGSTNSCKSEKSRKKDFIKRNIALAAKAHETVSLTEQEKQRLNELLSDESDLLLVDNPFSKNDSHKLPSGYELDEDAKKALTDIDEKLKCLVPQSDFESVCFSPLSDEQLLTGRTSNSVAASKQGWDVPGDRYGDGILKQEKHYREMQQRLQQIEAELEKIDKLEEAGSHSDSPKISSDLLHQLLEVDSRLTSSALSILDSARSNLDSARTDANKEIYEPSLDGSSCLDCSTTSFKEKSYHDIGV